MDCYTELRQQIGQDLDTLKSSEGPKSIFELADAYLLADADLTRQVLEDIIKQEADKRSIEIH